MDGNLSNLIDIVENLICFTKYESMIVQYIIYMTVLRLSYEKKMN